MNARKCIKKQRNSKGNLFAMVTDGYTYEVWTLSENYDGKCAGGIRKTWRYVSKGMNKMDADQLYKRRIS